MLSKDIGFREDSGSSNQNLRMDHATSAISSQKESPPKRCEECLLVSSVSVHGKTLCFDNVLPGGWSDTIRRIF